MSLQVLDTLEYPYKRTEPEDAPSLYPPTYGLVQHEQLALVPQHTFEMLAYDGAGLLKDYGIDDRSRYLDVDSDHYVCEDDHLILITIRRKADSGEPPMLDGIMPRVTSTGVWIYEGLNIPVPFTGNLLIGQNISEEWVANTPPVPWEYRTVIELHFEAGRLLQVTDHSDRARELQALVRTSRSETWGANPPVPMEKIYNEALAYTFGFYRGEARIWRKRA